MDPLNKYAYFLCVNRVFFFFFFLSKSSSLLVSEKKNTLRKKILKTFLLYFCLVFYWISVKGFSLCI